MLEGQSWHMTLYTYSTGLLLREESTCRALELSACERTAAPDLFRVCQIQLADRYYRYLDLTWRRETKGILAC